MVVICSNCKARLQLDGGKIPPHSFKVRCPKCQSGIEIKSSVPEPASESAMSLPADMTPPAAHGSPFERPPVAAPFKSDASEDETTNESAPSSTANDLAQLLAQVLHDKDPASKSGSRKRSSWDRRKALVCTDTSYCKSVAGGLAEQDFEVFVAENTAEALGRMREDRINVLVLDPNFDPVEQGFAFVMREIKLMRPAERRRLFLAYITPNARTMDLHAAFLHNANLVVNPADVERLPDALEVSLRHYNELYREFNRALDVPPI